MEIGDTEWKALCEEERRQKLEDIERKIRLGAIPSIEYGERRNE